MYDPFDGSVVSHFISLPGVIMSNCCAARLVTVELLIMLPVSSVPKYLPSASAAAFSVLPAAAAGAAAAKGTNQATAAAVTATAVPSRRGVAR